jgi:hypothetical protein
MWWYRERAELPTTERDEYCDCDENEWALVRFRQTQPQGNSRSCVRFKDVERTLEEIIIDASAWLGSSYEGTDLSWIGQENY